MTELSRIEMNWFTRTIARTNPVAENLEARVLRYRRAGSDSDGLHILMGYQVDDLDYALQGADNSCARINHPGIEVATGQWFAIKKGSDLSKRWLGNSHGSSDDGGKTFYNESAYLGMPRAKFQSSPAEVVWHHSRVTELRGQGIEQSERVRIMTAERANKPWDKTKSAHIG